MCSLIEAWGDNDFAQMTGRTSIPSATEASMNGVRNNQVAMDAQRTARQSTDLSAIRAMSKYPEHDKLNEPVTWSDNRRQYAQPANELMNINGGEPESANGWQTAYCKPRQDMNSMTRGVHSRYSREKRFDAMTAELPYGGQITTDVDPAMITGDANGRPGYLNLFTQGYEGRKWMPNMTTTSTQPAYAGDARPEAGINPPPTTTGYSKRKPTTSSPMAANDVPEGFMEIYDDTFDDTLAHTDSTVHQPIKSPFTEEVITDPRIIAQNIAARSEQIQQDSGNKQAGNVKSPITPVPDDIRAIQTQLNTLVAKMNNLEQKVNYVENNKSHDIILFIVIAIFVLFVLDNVFKLGKFS